MWKSQGRAYSRNLGRCLILGTRKGTFFNKGHQKFYLQPPLNPSALYWNKALYNFCKRGQRSIVKYNIRSRLWGLEYALQGVLSWDFQEVSYKFAEFPGGKLVFSGISSSRGFLKKVWKFKKLEQNRWLCSFSYALFMLL